MRSSQLMQVPACFPIVLSFWEFLLHPGERDLPNLKVKGTKASYRLENLTKWYRSFLKALLHPDGRALWNFMKWDSIFLKAGNRGIAPSWWQSSSIPNLTKWDRSFFKAGKCHLAPSWQQNFSKLSQNFWAWAILCTFSVREMQFLTRGLG